MQGMDCFNMSFNYRPTMDQLIYCLPFVRHSNSKTRLALRARQGRLFERSGFGSIFQNHQTVFDFYKNRCYNLLCKNINEERLK